MNLFRLKYTCFAFVLAGLFCLTWKQLYAQPDARGKFQVKYIHGLVFTSKGDTLEVGNMMTYDEAKRVVYAGDTGLISLYNPAYWRLILPEIKPEAQTLYYHLNPRVNYGFSHRRESYSFRVEDVHGVILDLRGQRVWPGSSINAKSERSFWRGDSAFLPETCVCLWHHFEYVGDTSWAIVSHPELGRLRIPDLVEHASLAKLAKFPCGKMLKPEEE